jgi:hypothetical protein
MQDHWPRNIALFRELVVDQTGDLPSRTEQHIFSEPTKTNQTEPPFHRQLAYLTYKYNKLLKNSGKVQVS